MKIEDLVLKAHEAKLAIEKYSSELASLKQYIQKYFDKSTSGFVSVDNIIASKRERVDITYFPEKLRESLSKKIFNKVTNKKYYIKDLEGLVELLKEAGVSPSEFKKLIDVEITVNKEAMKQAYEVGDISKEDLAGCYSAKIIKYVQLNEGKEKGGTD